MVLTPWLNVAVALGIGLLIGLERERTKGEGPTRRPAGIRTFAVAALLGAVASHLGGMPLLAVASAGVIVLTALSSARRQTDDPGMTTEIGLIATPLLGGLAMSDMVLASGLGVTIAVMFAAKLPLHNFVTRTLTETEVKDGLVFTVATLVIWPQLPDRYMGPMQALNPHSIWFFVILVLALGACGHLATRALGSRFGLPLAGLASGFVSSTATIGSMGGRAAKDPLSLNAAVAGAAFSTVATFIQLGVLLSTVSWSALVLMAPALTVGALTAALYGLLFAMRGATGATMAEARMGQAFSVGTAIGLATMMAVMLVVAAALRAWLGESGIIVGAAVAGFVDAHAAAVSVAALTVSAALPPQDAVLPIMAALTSNGVAKVIVAIGTGSRGFLLRVAPAVILSLAAAWAAASVTMPA